MAAQRISLVLPLYDDGHTSPISNGDPIKPVLTSSPNSQSIKSGSAGRYWPHGIERQQHCGSAASPIAFVEDRLTSIDSRSA